MGSFEKYPSSVGSSGNGLPSGYEWIKDGISGDLQLWKTDVSPNVLITSQNIGEFDVNGSLRASINTVYLEKAHSISSAGEEVTFKNLETMAHYTPVWGFTSEEGDTVGKASALEEGPLTGVNINGFPTLAFTAPCVIDYPVENNRSIYSYTVKSAEEYSGKLYLEVLNGLGDRVFSSENTVTLSVGSDAIFDKMLYRVRVGNVRTVKILKSDKTPLLVYAGAIATSEPYAHITCRDFVDREIVTVGSDGKIPIDKLPDIDTVERVVVANQAARLAIPQTTKFIIAIQSDVQRQYYLEGGQNPAVLANWTDGGSTASAVTAFNGRTGAVTPQSGDYTASQVGAVASPASDGARRVFVGSTPTLETIVDNLTSTSSSSPLSAAQGKVLNDSKQATITGAASTVTSSNLSASSAVVTDASGKLAASATVSATELGYLDGVTSAIQTQLNGKQATITGAASTVVSSNLSNGAAVVTDSGGKLSSLANVSSTEVGYLDGVNNPIQTQLNAKLSSSLGAGNSKRILVTDDTGAIVPSPVMGTNAHLAIFSDGNLGAFDLAASRAMVTDIGGLQDVSVTTAAEIGYLSGVTSSVQTQLNGKQSTITGAASTVTSSDLTSNAVVVSDGSGKLTASSVVSATELGYLDGVTSSIQTQLDSKKSKAERLVAVLEVSKSANTGMTSTVADGSYVAERVWYDYAKIAEAGCSLNAATGVFTLPAGTFEIEVKLTMVYTSGTYNAILRNITSGTDVISVQHTYVSGQGQQRGCKFNVRVTTTGSTKFAIQQSGGWGTTGYNPVTTANIMAQEFFNNLTVYSVT